MNSEADYVKIFQRFFKCLNSVKKVKFIRIFRISLKCACIYHKYIHILPSTYVIQCDHALFKGCSNDKNKNKK